MMEENFDELYYNDLGMCGCGLPEELQVFLMKLLDNHKKYWDKEIDYKEMSDNRKYIIKETNSDIIFEFIFHVFENSGFLEHGSSVYSSWLTDKGKLLLQLLKNKHE